MNINFIVPEAVPGNKEATDKARENWMIQNLRNMGTGYINYVNTNTDYTQMCAWHDASEGKFFAEDYGYVTSFYDTVSPAQLVNWPIIQPKIETVVNKYMTLPDGFDVWACDEDSIQEKMDSVHGLKMAAILYGSREKARQVTGIDFHPAEYSGMNDEDMLKLLQSNPVTAVEETMLVVVKYIREFNQIKQVLKTLLRDMVIYNRCFGRVTVDSTGGRLLPNIIRFDPRAAIYDYDSSRELIDRPSFFGGARFMTLHEITAEYHLTTEQTETVANMVSSGAGYNSMGGFMGNSWLHNEDGILRVMVVTAQVMGKSKQVMETTANPFDPDNPNIRYVPEGQKPSKTAKTVTQYANEAWEGTLIGGSIPVKVRKMPRQFKNISWNSDPVVLDGFGCIKKGISVVASLMNFQAMTNIGMYYMETNLARSGGKMTMLDQSIVPPEYANSWGKWAKQGKESGVLITNYFQDGMNMLTQRLPQGYVVDYSTNADLQYLIAFMGFIDDFADRACGISKQMQGIIGQYQKVGTAQQAIAQSSLVTAGYYDLMTSVENVAYNKLLIASKYCFQKGDTLSWMSNGKQQLFKVFQDISQADWGFLLRRGTADMEKKQKIDDLAENLAHAGQIAPDAAIDILYADSAPQARMLFKHGLDAMKKMQAQEQQSTAQTAQTQAENEQAKINVPIEVAKINSKTQIILKGMDIDNATAKILADKDMQDAIAQQDALAQAADQQHEMMMQASQPQPQQAAQA